MSRKHVEIKQNATCQTIRWFKCLLLMHIAAFWKDLHSSKTIVFAIGGTIGIIAKINDTALEKYETHNIFPKYCLNLTYTSWLCLSKTKFMNRRLILWTFRPWHLRQVIIPSPWQTHEKLEHQFAHLTEHTSYNRLSIWTF